MNEKRFFLLVGSSTVARLAGRCVRINTSEDAKAYAEDELEPNEGLVYECCDRLVIGLVSNLPTADKIMEFSPCKCGRKQFLLDLRISASVMAREA